MSDLYHSVVERAPADRAAYLNEACAGDEALRQEVESLLRFEPASDRFLERPAAAVIVDGAAASSVVGRQLGAFRILALLGTGGMGEVYRARDTKLGRDVALKILPAHFTADPERRARFAREARLLATLNDPHIGAIYGLEDADGLTALVLELVEGPTLADRLERGPLLIPEALAIACQIAQALDAAHQNGIVHRDLKPANIVLQGTSGTSGSPRAKVLDFGLAKAISLPGDSTPRQTGSVDRTAEGRILGTPAYMSPEQARGLPVDKRTDIWAFGCILFEMLTGRRAFDADTMAETFARILEHDPDWAALPRGAPEPARKLVRRCLTKDPDNRLRDIGDAALELADSHSTDASVGSAEARPVGQLPSWRWAAATMLLIVVSAVAARSMWPMRSTPRPERPVMKLDMDLGPDVWLGSGHAGPAVAISPNGERLVFESNGRLMTRRLDQPVSVPLMGTEGVSRSDLLSFFFSPDSEAVAFVADGKLKRLALDGGSVVTICDSPAEGRGGTWGDDGTIVFAGMYEGLMRVRAGGGPAEPLTRLDRGEITHRWPQILPGGKAVLFTSHTAATWWSRARIEVLSLADNRRKTVQERATFGRFVTDAEGAGYLTFVRSGILFAAAFDPVRLELLSPPIPVLEDVAYDNGGAAQIDGSKTGTVVMRRQAKFNVAWLDSAGSMPLFRDPGDYQGPAVSHDGNRVAYSAREDIWVYDVRRDMRIQVTKGQMATGSKAWSSDDQFIVFSTPEGIWYVRSDGGSEPRLLLPAQAPRWRVATSITGDRHTGRLAFHEFTVGSGSTWDQWTVPIHIDGTEMRAGKPEPFLQTKNDERHLDFSPDGRWIAYVSREAGGRHETYVRGFPDDGRRWKASDGVGFEPRWSPRRAELFFQAEEFLMMAPYSVHGAVFSPGKPRVWSRQPLPLLMERGGPVYSVSPDGRVVAIVPDRPSEEHFRRRVTLWVNAVAEFRRQVPIDR